MTKSLEPSAAKSPHEDLLAGGGFFARLPQRGEDVRVQPGRYLLAHEVHVPQGYASSRKSIQNRLILGILRSDSSDHRGEGHVEAFVMVRPRLVRKPYAKPQISVPSPSAGRGDELDIPQSLEVFPETRFEESGDRFPLLPVDAGDPYFDPIGGGRVLLGCRVLEETSPGPGGSRD